MTSHVQQRKKRRFSLTRAISLVKTLILSICIANIAPTLAHDNVHFYRATHLFTEPRFEKPWLTTLEFTLGGGRTDTGFDGCGHKTNILNIYGLHNMHQLGVNIPQIDPSNPLDAILLQLAALPAQPPFGTLSFNGTFSTIELNALFIQNFTHGLFLESHLPIRSLAIQDIAIIDQTPETGDFNKNTPEWHNFLSSFDAILARYNLSKAPTHGMHAGDTSILIGWTCNYQETKKLDFIDVTVKAGLLIPTGKAQDPDKIFSLPYGYNKHWGFPLSAQMAIGCFEWLSVGAGLQTLFFAPKTDFMRIKTAPTQSGLISLASACTHNHPGIQLLAGTYLKADHIIRGFSLLAGYSWAHQTKSTLFFNNGTQNNTALDPAILNSQEQFKSYSMHTLHFFIEYDFTKEKHIVGPRIISFANIPISARRIFKTNCYEIGCGLEITL